MKKLTVNEVREKYLIFFENKEHMRLKSFSLVPQNDKSLLLINSGMAPMKAYFTGKEVPPAKRIATCQKCIRTGDMENVGKTARHGTFFEMLGNFSFGDYFKDEIIPWSWEFVTKELEIPEDKLYVTIYEEDDESGDVWHEKVGVPRNHIKKLGKEDNFWQHGTGPCGPCTEIYYDRGEEYGCDSPTCDVGCDCDRYMEFWNLVLTQFNANEDGTYSELAQKNVDTGMGLERMATILQGVDSIFDVDTVMAVRDKVCSIANVKYTENKEKDVSIRVITDHIRSVTMMTADGVIPSNEGRGYVLRRLLRRAARHGKILGINAKFLADLSKTVVECSQDEYSELKEKSSYIFKIISTEEESFYKTLDKGMEILKSYIEDMKKDNIKVMSGENSFKLYDTYGFPLDLTSEILEENKLSIDEDAFNIEMKKQKDRARSARKTDTYMGAEDTVYNELPVDLVTEFVGYNTNAICLNKEVLENKDILTNIKDAIDNLDSIENLQGEVVTSKIIALVVNGEIKDTATVDDQVVILLDKTPFYGESGGQSGDSGIIFTKNGYIKIDNTIKVVGSKIAQLGTVIKSDLPINVNDEIIYAYANKEQRSSTSKNHTATHLLQKALRVVLGDHVEQSGSLVTKDRLRFDFTHFSAMTESEIKEVETKVNEIIFSGLNINIKEMSIDEARNVGATALFGEKYGDIVRVVNVGSGVSVELCGGTHVLNTLEIGTFKILSESGVASGIRRIEALTGKGALEHFIKQEEKLKDICKLLKSSYDEVNVKVDSLVKENKDLIKEAEKVKSSMVSNITGEIFNKKKDLKGTDVIIEEIDGMSIEDLRTLGDQLKNKIGSGVIVLVGKTSEKADFLVMATDDCVKAGVHCGKIVKELAIICGGNGGGRPNMAQAGGKDTSKIQEALKLANELLEKSL